MKVCSLITDKMRDPHMMVYFELDGRPGLCDCCDILFLKTIVIGFTVLTAVSYKSTVGKINICWDILVIWYQIKKII